MVKCTKGYVNGYLKERDGIPLLIKSDHSKINGYLIYFNSGKEAEAYYRIIDIEPDEVYRWEEVTVNQAISANALLGKREQRGSSDIENIDEWDGKNDPLFLQGVEEVEAILNNNSSFTWDYKKLFRLQMGYLLLWSAIERYAGLKYHLGKRANEKVYKIALEECFKDSLKKNVKKVREVFSATDLEKYVLDPNDPEKSIRYYYQIRSNAIHRGKAVTNDFDTVKSSLTELLAIFKDLLKNAFDEKSC
ncbi:MAG: hypothetical protein KF816_06290 [Melioribacteraceae bacterium]|nr:hypothetical protein [Melioribacteraceae bacterium]